MLFLITTNVFFIEFILSYKIEMLSLQKVLHDNDVDLVVIQETHTQD